MHKDMRLRKTSNSKLKFPINMVTIRQNFFVHIYYGKSKKWTANCVPETSAVHSVPVRKTPEH